MSIACVYFGNDRIINEINRMSSQDNRIEYSPLLWDNVDNDIESLPEIHSDPSLPGKYSTTITNILSKQCNEIKINSDEKLQSLSNISKKKLKDLVTKHNNEIFSFMIHPDKIPKLLNIAETIFRRYGQELPLIKGQTTQHFLKDLNLNSSIDDIVSEFNDGLQKLQGDNSLDDFIKQLKWLYNQYRIIGEEVLRLETTLFQKIDYLDKLNNRIPIITSLKDNEALPELIDSFTKYATKIYESSNFEQNYKELVEAYKKWNICRQIISIQPLLKNDKTEPQCSICLLEPISSAIVPCGHTFCSNCSKKQNTTCFICRGKIRERIKLFFT
jgi:Zinc finger, C3HC4 type (RING finger)